MSVFVGADRTGRVIMQQLTFTTPRAVQTPRVIYIYRKSYSGKLHVSLLCSTDKTKAFMADRSARIGLVIGPVDYADKWS